jgi:hypothetical protein
MRKRPILATTIATLFFALALISSGLAQDESCAALIQTAFDQLNTNCADMPGSAACFGSAANATFANGSGTGFAAPGDQVPLSDIQSIHTQPLSEAQDAWGLALLHVHANVPLALSEQGLKFFLIGDIEVENAVDPADAFTPAESLTVEPMVAANLRSGPSTDARVLTSASVGTALAADGLSSDLGWLRVLDGDQTAWISRQVIVAKDGDINSLPLIGTNTRTLMQSFMLKTGNGSPSCADVPPSMLLIQSPGSMTANITVNGVDIRFDGAIVLHISLDNVLRIIVLNGVGNMGGVSVPAGFTLSIPLDADGQGSSGLATGLRPIDSGERDLLLPVTGSISGDVLYTALNVPTQEETNALLAQLNGAAGSQVTSGPASGQADCTRFRPTSPLGGVPEGVAPFYWDAAPGATAYRINLYDAGGGLVTSINASAASTTFQVDTSAFGSGASFAWNVEALVDGQVACSSGRVNVVHDIFSQPVSNGNGGNPAPPPKPTACSWSGC